MAHEDAGLEISMPEYQMWQFLPGECHGECSFEHQLLTASATADFLVKHLGATPNATHDP